MRGDEILLLCFFVAALAIVILALYFRYRKQQLFHQERMAALDKGLPVPQAYTPRPWSPRVYLLRGLMWSFAGIALSVFLLGIALTTQRPQSAENVLWRTKNLAQSAGITAEEAKQIIEKDPNTRQDGMPLGVALLGLIPIAVGAAYLIFYHSGNKDRDDSPASTQQS
jgi:uncharacterized membrane protein